ncbi:MAG TPA: hypothetical protein VNI61_12675, partial [Gemmatimonadales bacterium]|nr:hypothetical protein [Gemmatimonadales bacterium]
MRTIRGRLAGWYAASLALTLAAFGVVVYVAGRRAAYQELDRRIEATAELAAGILRESYRAGNVVVRGDSSGKPQLVPELAATLEAIPDYLVIVHREGRVLFLSAAARALSLPQAEDLAALAAGGASGGGVVRLEVNGPTLHYVVRPVTGAGPQLGAVLAGADTQRTERALQGLGATIVFVILVGVVAAVLVGE